MATPLNTVRQEIADNEASQAKLKAEGRKICQTVAADRTSAQQSRLKAIDSELAQLAEELVPLAEKRADLERQQGVERTQIAGMKFGEGDRGLGRPAAGPKWEQIFHDDPSARDYAGFQPGEFANVFASRLFDPRLHAMQAVMTEGVGSAGGFGVPPAELGAWWNDAVETSIVVPRAVIWRMSTDTRRVPAFDYRNRASDLAGFSIAWKAEASDLTLQTGKIRLIVLRARAGYIMVEISNEAKDDGVGLVDQLNSALVTALSYGLDQSFLSGAGGNQPLGVLHANCATTITVSKENGQSASTIVYANLLKMFARMTAASIPNSVWIAHPSTIPQLSTMSVTVGTGGSVIPVMTSSNGQFTILTRPVIFSEKMQPLGTKGDVLLADWSQYVIGIRKDATLDRSSHVGFTRDTETFRLMLRVDGQPAVDTPYQPPNSAPTMSPFVTLETRA